MSRAVLSPGSLTGTASPPPSKSAAHRAILCAGLASGSSTLTPVSTSADMAATVDCISALGASVHRCENTLQVTGISVPSANAVLDCAESGSTLRFLIPIATALGVKAKFVGHGRLPQRPLGVYLELLPKHGVSVQSENGLPFTVSGQLLPGIYEVPGNVSSQFITGLLFALPLLPKSSELRLTTALQSSAYIDMTIQMLHRFGIRIDSTGSGWIVPGNQQYHACAVSIERDWSQAAFLLTAAAVNGKVSLTGLNPASAQGDREIEALLRRFGAHLTWKDGVLTAEKSVLHGIDIDVSQIPDLAPALAVAGAYAQGRTRLLNGARLRLKESDRLTAMHRMITALGGSAQETDDSLIIHGGISLPGGTVDGCNDHRIIMAACAAALGTQNEVTVTDAGAVRKSWPEFFSVYRSLGGKADVIMGK